MSKATDAAAIAASVKKVAADAAATGDTVAERPRFALFEAPKRVDGRGSLHARLLVADNLGKKRHRRGWCSL